MVIDATRSYDVRIAKRRKPLLSSTPFSREAGDEWAFSLRPGQIFYAIMLAERRTRTRGCRQQVRRAPNGYFVQDVR